MKDIICDETARLCLQVYRDGLRAVILTGSLARNEGTFVKDDAFGSLLLGDAEFLLLFQDRVELPSEADVEVIQRKIEERVRQRGLHVKITLGTVRTNYLRDLPPSIFAYELRAAGETVGGDPDVLSLIPEFTRADIPPEDAWRMLANRLVEQLQNADELLDGREMLSPRVHYSTVKLYLDMATSLLVFVGGYAPTYEQRADNLATLSRTQGRNASWPFSLEQFTRDVVACTRWKLSTKEPAVDADRGFWEQAVDYAQGLWLWELARLVGSGGDRAPANLMTLWMRRQSLRHRLRGWAYVARRCGWHRSLRRWPHWLPQALTASPRYLVYAAASEVLFAIPRQLPGGARRTPPELGDALAGYLPVLRNGGLRTGATWDRLAADIVWNYNEFLLGTRA